MIFRNQTADTAILKERNLPQFSHTSFKVGPLLVKVSYRPGPSGVEHLLLNHLGSSRCFCLYVPSLTPKFAPEAGFSFTKCGCDLFGNAPTGNHLEEKAGLDASFTCPPI